jgi:predicted Zn finger-like uncharacterized protein
MSLGGAYLNMITRCPSCATAFRVTEPQLHARAGQVRCGRCGTTFNALATLISDSAGRAGPGKGAIPTLPGAAPLLDSAFDFGPPARARRSRLWWLASVVALLVLLLQVAYHYRTEIGLLLPESKPLIQRLCAALGCEVPLPHRADLLSIESSDLQADGANPSVMVLTATLRNRAAFVQAYPALELTLTNAQDQSVARRVLMPRDYAARGMKTDSGFAAGSELQIRVYVEAAALRATGYRLYMFYL